MEERFNTKDVYISMFKLWSQIDNNAEVILHPDFGYRKWDELSKDDRQKIWSYLWREWFFNMNDDDIEAFYSDESYITDKNKEQTEKFGRIMYSLDAMNYNYKANAYARNFLDNRNISNALDDFYSLYLNAQEAIVFELLSFYAKKVITDYQNGLNHRDQESDEEFRVRNDKYKWSLFDKFAHDLNDVFEHFGIYVFLTRNGFAPRQDEKIVNEIYEPVLKILSAEEYKETNEMLKKAFGAFQNKDYSGSIINSINAIQAYLQMEVHGKTSKGNLSTLFKEAAKKNLIPSDVLMSDFYGKIESYFAQMRMSKTDAHPSYIGANESDALLIMNLAVIILQSFVNFKKI